jgi:sugar phosphate isomerase/epimerase
MSIGGEDLFKLAFTTFMLTHKLDFDESIKLAKDSGCAGIDFRTGDPDKYKHTVELERTLEERKAMRRKLEDNYLEVASINTGYEFDSPDEAKRREQIELAKKECELAYDLGCSLVRVFGNYIRTDDARECVAYVAKAIQEVTDHAAPLGVTVMLEMHFDFNYWGYALEVARLVDRPNFGLLYNCDKRDLVGGSCVETFRRVAKYIRHVHVKDLSNEYPFVELLEELVRIGYDGYLSAEIAQSADPTRVLQLHNIAVRSMIEIARRNVMIRG